MFNNVAVAAAACLNVYGLERVAIVDWDVHHGNGTQVCVCVCVCVCVSHSLAVPSLTRIQSARAAYLVRRYLLLAA